MSVFEKRVKPILQYVGAIGAVLSCIAYIIFVVVLIWGFKVDINSAKQILFPLVNAAMGFIIMQMLKYQGISFAKQEHLELIKRFYNRSKQKKIHTITHYWIVSVIKDIFVKCTTFALSTGAIIYIAIEGTKDYNLLLLAIVNLVMFICFGLLALNSAYEAYNNNQVPYMTNKLKEQEQENNNERLTEPPTASTVPDEQTG